MRPALLVAHAGFMGGAERVLLDWGRALDTPPLLACPPGELAEAAVAAGLHVELLRPRPLRRRGRAIRASGDLAALAVDVARLARRRRPSAIVASGQRPILAAAASFAAPLVALHHDLPPGRVSAALLRAAATRAGALVATSHAIARAVERSGRAIVVHPGIDADAWSLPDPPPGPPRALVLGALVPWKRPDLALEIAALVPELSLDLAGAPLHGDPPEFVTALRNRADRPDLAGRVRFLGALADPGPALAEAHCLLHCADREPYGLALLEALAAGRPVVAPAAGGPLELVTPACGRLYLPGDAGAGAAAVRAALGEPALRDGARARAAAFPRGAAAARFGEVVARVAAGQRL
jgi:glycosyltransferase involved in cell wall biosynthesis